MTKACNVSTMIGNAQNGLYPNQHRVLIESRSKMWKEKYHCFLTNQNNIKNYFCDSQQTDFFVNLVITSETPIITIPTPPANNQPPITSENQCTPR